MFPLKIAKASKLLGVGLGIFFFVYNPQYPALQEASKGTKATKVLLIGGAHSYHLILPHYAPMHIRSLLAKYQPDILGVENPPKWHRDKKLLSSFLVELYVAMEWGKENNRPVYGIDWRETVISRSEPEMQKLSSISEKLASGDIKIRDQIKRWFDRDASFISSLIYSDIRMDALYIHTTEMAKDMKALKRVPPDQLEIIYQTEEKIAQTILSVVKSHQGKRMAVVIGKGHVPLLEKYLTGKDEIQLVDILEFLPLSEQEIEANTLLTDVYMILSQHLDGVGVEWGLLKQDWRRAHELLNRALLESPDSPVTKYFQARWDWLMGDLKKAEKVLLELIKLDDNVSFPFPVNRIWSWPPLSSVRAKAIFTLANIYDYLGQREKSLPLYREIIDAGENLNAYGHQLLFTSYDVEKFIKNFLEEPYCRCEEEMFRSMRYMYDTPYEGLRGIPWRW